MKNKNNIVNTDINKIISFLKDNVDNVNLNDFKLEIMDYIRHIMISYYMLIILGLI